MNTSAKLAFQDFQKHAGKQAAQELLFDDQWDDFQEIEEQEKLARVNERAEEASDDDSKRAQFIDILPEESGKEDGSPLDFRYKGSHF